MSSTQLYKYGNSHLELYIYVEIMEVTDHLYGSK